MCDNHGDDRNPETLLLDLKQKLVDLFEAIGIGKIATVLYRKRLINDETYQSMDMNITDKDKSRKIMQGVIVSVKANSINYDKFVEVLDGKSHEKEIIKILKKECKYKRL